MAGKSQLGGREACLVAEVAEHKGRYSGLVGCHNEINVGVRY